MFAGILQSGENTQNHIGLHKNILWEMRVIILQKKAKNLLKIASIYLGTVLGAGFASGQELLLFFVRFSRRGLLGCFIAGVLFSFLGALILSRSYELSEKTYRAYLAKIFGKKFASFLALVAELFLCVSFCIMLSGAGAFFVQRFSWPLFSGILITDAICLLVFLYDLKGLATLNLILTPVMLVGTVFVSLYSILFGAQAAWLPQINSQGIFLPFALFYVGYNLLTATAVLVPAGSPADSRHEAAKGGILGGFFLFVMAMLCCLALYFDRTVWESPLPMLLLSKRAGDLAYFLYSLVLYMAMLTTAVSTGFSVVQSLAGIGVEKRNAAFAVCLLAIPLSFVEFSVLVKHCYVFFGIIGILLLAGILWDWYRKT